MVARLVIAVAMVAGLAACETQEPPRVACPICLLPSYVYVTAPGAPDGVSVTATSGMRCSDVVDERSYCSASGAAVEQTRLGAIGHEDMTVSLEFFDDPEPTPSCGCPRDAWEADVTLVPASIADGGSSTDGA